MLPLVGTPELRAVRIALHGDSVNTDYVQGIPRKQMQVKRRRQQGPSEHCLTWPNGVLHNLSAVSVFGTNCVVWILYPGIQADLCQ